MQNPHISIVIPVFARTTDLSFLSRCLEALRSSTYDGDFEIIVVDDCSAYPDLVEQTARQYDARYILLDQNSGPGVSRNRGAEAAKGPILAFIDADCVAPPGWLAAITGPIRKGHTRAVTSTYSAPVHSNWLTIYQNDDMLFRTPNQQVNTYFVHSHSFVIERDAFLSVGGFPNQRVSEDMVLGIRLAESSITTMFLPEASIYHDYPDTLRRYFRQRHGFGFNTTVFGVKRLLQTPRAARPSNTTLSFNPLRTLFGMLAALLITLLVAAAALSVLILPRFTMLICALLILALILHTVVHGRFLIFVCKRHNILRAASYMPLIVLTDLTYMIAAVRGLFTALRAVVFRAT